MNYSKLRILIENHELTQKKIASLVGMTPHGIKASISNNTLKVRDLESIADVLGVDVCVFFKDREQSSKKIIGNNNFVAQDGATQTSSNNNNISANEELLKALKQTIKDKQEIIDLLKTKVK